MRKRSLLLIENQPVNEQLHNGSVRAIIAGYSGLVKLYCMIRFRIIPLRFLQEMEQYLPNRGLIVELGCGFGLFSLYMAMQKPNAQIIGLDLDQRRVQMAQRAADDLDIRNVSFERRDLREWVPDRRFSAGYALDVFHHLPVETGNRLLHGICACLEPDGYFLLKDVDTRPRLALAFTYVLDLMMSPRSAFYYRASDVWRSQLQVCGFGPIYQHKMWDLLPYPHVLFVCSKPSRPE